MKRMALVCGFMALSAALFTSSSCKKIKDEIVSNISPFVYSSTQAFEVPAPLPVAPYTAPQQSETINLNQVVKDNSGLGLDVSNFSYIGLKDVTLQLTNGTDANNWLNFEYIEIQVNTDKGIAANRPWLTARNSINISDAGQAYGDKVLTFPAQNMKEYINGHNTTIYYRFSTNVVHPVTATMKMNATVRYEFKP